MNQFSIKLDKKLRERVEKIANDYHCSMATIIRISVVEYLDFIEHKHESGVRKCHIQKKKKENI